MNLFDSWKSFLDFVALEHNRLAAILSNVGFHGIHNQTIILAAPLNSFARSQLRILNNLLMDLIRSHFGDVQLKLIDEQASLEWNPSLTLIEEHKIFQHRENLLREACLDPRMDLILKSFNGRIDSIEAEGTDF